MSGEIGITTNVVEEQTREFEITLRVTEHDTAIFAGFQQMWGEGEVDGETVEISTGSGVGSSFGVVRFGGKSYVFRAQDIVGAVVEKAKEEVAS